MVHTSILVALVYRTTGEISPHFFLLFIFRPRLQRTESLEQGGIQPSWAVKRTRPMCRSKSGRLLGWTNKGLYRSQQRDETRSIMAIRRRGGSGVSPSQELRHFTDREDAKAVFVRLFERPAGASLPVLMFYRVGGMGKS